MMNTCRLLFYRYHCVSAIKTGRGEIIVEKIGLESCQTVEVVFGPLPDIAVRVVEPHGVGRVHVDRLWWDGRRGREGRRKRREGEEGKESERGKERGRGGRERKEGEEGRREVREGGGERRGRREEREREGEGERRIKMDECIDGLDRQRDRGKEKTLLRNGKPCCQLTVEEPYLRLMLAGKSRL